MEKKWGAERGQLTTQTAESSEKLIQKVIRETPKIAPATPQKHVPAEPKNEPRNELKLRSKTSLAYMKQNTATHIVSPKRASQKTQIVTLIFGFPQATTAASWWHFMADNLRRAGREVLRCNLDETSVPVNHDKQPGIVPKMMKKRFCC